MAGAVANGEAAGEIGDESPGTPVAGSGAREKGLDAVIAGALMKGLATIPDSAGEGKGVGKLDCAGVLKWEAPSAADAGDWAGSAMSPNGVGLKRVDASSAVGAAADLSSRGAGASLKGLDGVAVP